MPQNLTGVSGSFPVQTAPSAGDPRTVASVVTPYQAAANRAEYLKAHVDALEAITGPFSGITSSVLSVSTTSFVLKQNVTGISLNIGEVVTCICRISGAIQAAIAGEHISAYVQITGPGGLSVNTPILPVAFGHVVGLITIGTQYYVKKFTVLGTGVHTFSVYAKNDPTNPTGAQIDEIEVHGIAS